MPLRRNRKSCTCYKITVTTQIFRNSKSNKKLINQLFNLWIHKLCTQGKKEIFLFLNSFIEQYSGNLISIIISFHTIYVKLSIWRKFVFKGNYFKWIPEPQQLIPGQGKYYWFMVVSRFGLCKIKAQEKKEKQFNELKCSFFRCSRLYFYKFIFKITKISCKLPQTLLQT